MDNAEQPIEARVITTAGEEIHGYVQAYDCREHGQDVFTEYPQRIVRDDTGDISEETSIGDSVFVSDGEISHIYFESDIELS